MNKISKVAYIALGANLSNPKDNFQLALDDMQGEGIIVEQVSSLWHSPAWPAGLGHPDYINAVAKIRTNLSPEELLALLHRIESKYGRERTVLNAPRPLDLDIVDYGGVLLSGDLNLPHPRALLRPFVLLPLIEIDENWVHPISKESAFQALEKLTSQDVLDHHVIEREWLKSHTCVSKNQAI